MYTIAEYIIYVVKVSDNLRSRYIYLTLMTIFFLLYICFNIVEMFKRGFVSDGY